MYTYTNHCHQSAIAWILLYYVVLKPLNLLTIDSEYTAKLKAVGLSSRFGYFEVSRFCPPCGTLFCTYS